MDDLEQFVKDFGEFLHEWRTVEEIVSHLKSSSHSFLEYSVNPNQWVYDLCSSLYHKGSMESHMEGNPSKMVTLFRWKRSESFTKSDIPGLLLTV